MFRHPWFQAYLEWKGAKVVGDYSPKPTLAKLATAFPKFTAWLFSGRYNYALTDDDPINMAVYLHNMSGGTSLKNCKLLA
jgi:hypothetical protein